MKKTRSNDWKLYEETILQHFQEVYPDCAVLGNQKIVGVNSKQSRQIDILISGELAGFPIKVVVDCKHFSKKIDVKIVESFIGMLADVKASKGVIITNIGYTKAAVERAKFDSRDIQLDILDFEDLPQFSGVEDVVAYQHNEEENIAIIFSCPFGWKIHKVPMQGFPAGLTKENITWEQGLESKEVIYLALSSKTDFPKIEQIYTSHDEASQRNFPGVVFSFYKDLDESFENAFCEELVMRVGNYPQYPEVECSVFLDFGTFYAFFVLTSPAKNIEQNLKKLAFVVRTTVPSDFSNKSNGIPFEYLKFSLLPEFEQR